MYKTGSLKSEDSDFCMLSSVAFRKVRVEGKKRWRGCKKINKPQYTNSETEAAVRCATDGRSKCGSYNEEWQRQDDNRQRKKGETLEMKKTRGVKSERGANWKSCQVTGVSSVEITRSDKRWRNEGGGLLREGGLLMKSCRAKLWMISEGKSAGIWIRV